MKITAYYILHYGSEYLRESILSINDNVDNIVVLYTSKPSQGFVTDQICPETEQQLREIAEQTSNKIQWVNVTGVTHEGEHRNVAFKYAQDSDILMAIDADEVWDKASLERCLYEVKYGDKYNYGVLGFLNFYRNFENYCSDSFAPIRFTNLKNLPSDGMGYLQGKVYHFSLAQSIEMIKYKWLISGHTSELLPDFFDKLFNWTPGCDTKWLHPVSLQIWENTIPFDKTQLPKSLKEHKNYNLEIIP